MSNKMLHQVFLISQWARRKARYISVVVFRRNKIELKSISFYKITIQTLLIIMLIIYHAYLQFYSLKIIQQVSIEYISILASWQCVFNSHHTDGYTHHSQQLYTASLYHISCRMGRSAECLVRLCGEASAMPPNRVSES